MVKKWAGGRVREVDGKKTWYIRKRMNGTQFEFSLGVETEQEALAELALFTRDPAGYKTKKEQASEKAARGSGTEIRLDETTLETFFEYCDVLVSKEELSKRHVDYTLKPYCIRWGEKLGNKDLRKVSLEDLKAVLKTWTTAKHKRIVALKTFTSWAREEKEPPKLHRKDDPTIDLKTPTIIPAKSVKAKGYSMEVVEKLYAELTSQAARDVVCMRAKIGLHDTEIQRLARGRGEIRKVDDKSEIAGVLIFSHLKKGKQHAISCDAQTLSAAERLLMRGSSVSSHPMRIMINKACKRLGPKFPHIKPGELRHSFATWATTVGKIVHSTGQHGVDLITVAEVMGHLNKRTTAVFYVGDRVPLMIKLPLKLYHPDDPASETPKKQVRRGKKP